MWLTRCGRSRRSSLVLVLLVIRASTAGDVGVAPVPHIPQPLLVLGFECTAVRVWHGLSFQLVLNLQLSKGEIKQG